MICLFRRRFDRALIEQDANKLIERRTELRAYGESRQLAIIEAGLRRGVVEQARPEAIGPRQEPVAKKTRHDYLDSTTRRLDLE